MHTVRNVLDEKGDGVHHIHPDASVFDALTNHGGAQHRGIGRAERRQSRRHRHRARLRPQDHLERTNVARNFGPRDHVDASHLRVTDQTVEECMAVMTAKTVRHLPVLDHKELVGIVSIGDMVKCIIADQKFTIDQLEHYFQGGR